VTEGGGEPGTGTGTGPGWPGRLRRAPGDPGFPPPAPHARGTVRPSERRLKDLSGAEPAKAGLRLRNTQLAGVEGFPTDGGFCPSRVALSTNIARLSRTSPRDGDASDKAWGLLRVSRVHAWDQGYG
jgi:hypothetical protein